MRKSSKRQRFYVKDWLEKLNNLYSRVLENCRETSCKDGPSGSLAEKKASTPKTHLLLIRSGLPEILNAENIQNLQTRIELYENKLNESLLDCENQNDGGALPDEIEATLDFKLLAIGEISPLEIGSLRFKKNSLLDLRRNYTSELDVSELFDSVCLETIRKACIYTVRSFEQFDDDQGLLSKEFQSQLSKLGTQNSVNALCIAEIVKEGEREFFWNLRYYFISLSDSRQKNAKAKSATKGKLYETMQKGPLKWPLYTIILGFGQLLGFSVFQVALFNTEELNHKWVMFLTACIYIMGSTFWWALYWYFFKYFYLK